MAWTESHQALATHRKTLALADELGVNRAEAIGWLHLFWWWALDNAPSGNLKGIKAQQIATAIAYPNNSNDFVNALIKAGFVDRCGRGGIGLRIHDWDQYGGKLLRSRDRHRDVMRRARDRLEKRRVDKRSIKDRSSKENRYLDNSAHLARLQADYEKHFGQALTPTRAQAFADLAEEHGLDATLDALAEAAKRNKADPRYTKAILERWKVEGRGGNSEKVGHTLTRRETAELAVQDWERQGFKSEEAARIHYADALNS